MANGSKATPSNSRTFGQARRPETALKGHNARPVNPVIAPSEAEEAGANEAVLDAESEPAPNRNTLVKSKRGSMVGYLEARVREHPLMALGMVGLLALVLGTTRKGRAALALI